MAARVFLQRVVVEDIFSDGTFAVVRDENGARMDVPLTIRTGKGGWPQIGEVWIISREYGGWSFSALVDSGRPPVIRVDREEADDLAVKLLDALITLGLVSDGSDREAAPGAAEDFDDDSFEIAGGFNDGDDPPETPDESEVLDPSSLWIGTYNTKGVSFGNRAIQEDLKRLIASPVQVFGLQEMWNHNNGPGARDALAEFLEGHGFEVLRWEGSPAKEWNWICWRRNQFTKKDSGLKMLTGPVDPQPGIARWAMWVRLVHKDSGQPFVFINTHFVPQGRHAPTYHHTQATELASLVTTVDGPKWPVFTVGDLNENYRDSAQRTDPDLAVVKMNAVGSKCTWELLGQPAGIGTHGLALIDYIFKGPDPGGVAVVKEHRILRGYRSDHRPVIARVQMKRLDR